VRAYRDKCPMPAQVLMQLVLQVDEAVIAGRVELDASKYRTHNKRSHKGRLWLNRHHKWRLA